MLAGGKLRAVERRSCECVAGTRQERIVRGSAAELYSRMGIMGNNSGDGAGSIGDSGDTRQSVDIRKGGFVC